MSKSFSAVRQTQKPFRCSTPNLHKCFRTYFNCETSSSYIQLKVKMVGYLRLVFIFARLKNYAQRRWRMHNAFKMQNCLLRTFSKIKLLFSVRQLTIMEKSKIICRNNNKTHSEAVKWIKGKSFNFHFSQKIPEKNMREKKSFTGCISLFFLKSYLRWSTSINIVDKCVWQNMRAHPSRAK